MSSTAQFGLPLVQAAQAQKHVTVNEALSRLDAFCQLRLASRVIDAPPADPVEGVAYAVPQGGTGFWAGHDGQIAVYTNGGWAFQTPLTGWEAWVADEALRVTYWNGAWVLSVQALSNGAAVTRDMILEQDHILVAGSSNVTADIIPAGAIVYAVTGRVIDPVTGDTGTSWSLGVPGASGRYGSGYGFGLNSFAQGLTGQPQAYYSTSGLLIEADSGDFIGGTIRFAVHARVFSPPAPV